MKKSTISGSGIANPIPSHPLATRAGPLLFISGQMGLSEKSGRRWRAGRASAVSLLIRRSA
jgi:enamine deaminase RidA (YjgF/YER057c/UK114 family)